MVFYNILGMLLIYFWNLFILVGSVYLIDQCDWSKWTLVGTIFFIWSWKPEWPKKEEQEPSKIIL